MTLKDARDLLDSMLPRSDIYKRNINADKKLTESEKNTLFMIVIDFERMSGKYNYSLALYYIKKILDSRFRVSPSSKKNKKNGEVIYLNPPAVPFLVKQVIFFIAVSFIVYEDIEYTQADICRYLNLGHNFFEKLSKKPKEYLEMQQYIQPERFMTYNGQKDEERGIAIKNLVYQADIHDYFVDIFGGTGAASAAVIHRDNVQYVYNDKDKLMYNLFKVIADDELYIELIEAIKLLQEDLRGDGEWLTNVDFDAEVDNFYSRRCQHGQNEQTVKDENSNEIEYSYVDIVKYMQDNYDWIVSQNNNRVFPLRDGTTITTAELISKVFFNTDTNRAEAVMSFFDNYKIIEDVAVFRLYGKTQDANGNVIRDEATEKENKFIQYRFYKYFAYFDNLIESCNNDFDQKNRVLYAVAMIFCYNLTTKGSKGISSILRMLFGKGGRQNKASEPKRFLGRDFKSIITVVHNSIKGTICENEDYLKIINRYKSHGIQNAVSPLFYSDSPYVATKGYRIPFADTEIVKLIKELIDSGDKFIFSCRAVKSSDDETDEVKIETDKDKNKIIKVEDKIDAANDKIFRYVFGSFLAAPKIYVDVIDDKQDYKKFKVHKEKILNGDKPKIIKDKKNEYYKKLYVLIIGDKNTFIDAVKNNKTAEIMITNFAIASFEANIKKKKGNTVKEQEVKFQAYTFEEFLEVLCRNANNQLTALLKQKYL